MIRNITKDTVVAEHPRVAKSILWRMRGMIGRQFDDFDALIFRRNNSIHMFFMKMPLDIIFLDRKGKVVGLRENLQPWRMAMKWGSYSVVELPVGAISKSETAIGDELEVEPDLVV
jgi:uncharacterized membrane protein (UPF0127 family)